LYVSSEAMLCLPRRDFARSTATHHWRDGGAVPSASTPTPSLAAALRRARHELSGEAK
jgi:hypothetical protein